MSPGSLTVLINQLLPEPHAGLLAGILFGTKASINTHLYDALVTTGTIHIVALSGMNITILAAFVASLFQTFFSRRVVSLLIIICIVWFVYFVGPSPSIIRAAIMGILGFWSVYAGRSYWPIYSWVVAVIIMLIFNWSWLSNISFQLSALATLGIILFGPSQESAVTIGPKPSVDNVMNFFVRAIKNNFSVSLSAQVFTIPIILYHFHRVSLISPVANLLIGWTIAPVSILGWFAVLVALIWEPMGQMISWMIWLLLEYLIRVVLVVQTIPFASIGK